MPLELTKCEFINGRIFKNNLFKWKDTWAELDGFRVKEWQCLHNESNLISKDEFVLLKIISEV